MATKLTLQQKLERRHMKNPPALPYWILIPHLVAGTQEEAWHSLYI